MSSFVRQKKKKKKERPGIRKILSSLFHKELSKRFTTEQKFGGLFLSRPDQALDNTVPISSVCF